MKQSTGVGTFTGVVLYCLLTGGLRGLPGWALGNLVIGIIVGLTFGQTKKLKKLRLQAAINFLAIAASTALQDLIVREGSGVTYEDWLVLRSS